MIDNRTAAETMEATTASALENMKERGGFDYGIAALSEGYCPACGARLGPAKPDEDLPEVYTTHGLCTGSCGVSWATGPHGGNGKSDWMRVSDEHDTEQGHLQMSIGLNMPDDEHGDDEIDYWNDQEEDFE